MGSLVCDGPHASVLHVPALSVEVLDTTGAGDSYCGGFLAGLVAGRPVVECAVMGTVSASFVVQACGALVHRLAYNGDVVAFKMGRRQGARREHI